MMETPPGPAVTAATSSPPACCPSPLHGPASASSVVTPGGKLMRHVLVMTARGREEGTGNKSQCEYAHGATEGIPLSRLAATRAVPTLPVGSPSQAPSARHFSWPCSLPAAVAAALLRGCLSYRSPACFDVPRLLCPPFSVHQNSGQALKRCGAPAVSRAPLGSSRK